MLPKEIQDRVDAWLNSPIDQESKSEVLRLLREDPKTLEDAFYTTLSFGTGGMRGIMGAGTNRINLYTIRMATQGLANYLLKKKPLHGRHYVFIGYDNRINSKHFAMEAARVLAGNGIGVHLVFDLRPTPYISFGVRQKECSAGIMITASHNPKEYNGYKVYGKDGGQVTSPEDKEIVKEVQKVTDVSMVKLSPEKSTLIEIVNPEFDFEYLAELKKNQLDPKEDHKVGDQLQITYTPLHGTGITLLPKALKDWGFSNINPVDHQIIPDGKFPTLKTPNPEELDALAMGIKQLKETQSDILIATDPDADRVAVVCLHKNKPFRLNGNQIAVLCLEYICRTLFDQQKLPSNGAVVTTIVSTDLIGIIARHFKISCYEVLTGFKYIGQLMQEWEENRTHAFLFGAEESYGYLLGTYCRDKDAIIASCLISEIALLMKVEGRTLVDFLKEIYKKYGFFLEEQRVVDLPPGHAGMKKMDEMMSALRKKKLEKLNGISVKISEDYLEGLHGLPPANVLLYRLSDQSKIVVRPSGTEPKLKIYGAVFEPSWEGFEQTTEHCQKKLRDLFDAIESLL